MKALYDDLSAMISKMTTRKYSTSFSMGIYLIDKPLRNAIYAIYGFVRIADEIVDSFEGYNKSLLLKRFWEDTHEAIETRISVNPILNSFQEAVHRYHIDQSLIEVFLQSMEMDLEKVNYTEKKYQQYIFGSAEVVGLMCLHVFTEGDTALYKELETYARSLGAAFQKVNFLRDLKNDYLLLGRIYFPGVDLTRFNGATKKEIEADIEKDFIAALLGIKKLPASSKAGVYLAYAYYRSLFEKIKRTPASRIMVERIRINNGKKIGLMLNSLIQNKMNTV